MFSRNIGLVSKEELNFLSQSLVAIPGMGGVGGQHLITLTRMGIGNFRIADGDSFELANFNRQYGANVNTIGKNKSLIMQERALEINPHANIQAWDWFIHKSNIGAFLADVDLVIDSLDTFAIRARRLLYENARTRGIPVVSAGPIGFSVCMLVFLPESISFDDYFDCHDELSDEENTRRFLMGFCPKPHFLKYMDMSTVNIAEKRGPSSMAAVNLCAGTAGVTAIKILLGRGKVHPAPYYHYFDPYLMRFVLKKNRGILMRFFR